MDALVPCVIELFIASVPTIIEPSTATSATAAFPDLVGDAFTALVATAYCREYRGSIGRAGYFCGGMRHEQNAKDANIIVSPSHRSKQMIRYRT